MQPAVPAAEERGAVAVVLRTAVVAEILASDGWPSTEAASTHGWFLLARLDCRESLARRILRTPFRRFMTLRSLLLFSSSCPHLGSDTATEVTVGFGVPISPSALTMSNSFGTGPGEGAALPAQNDFPSSSRHAQPASDPSERLRSFPPETAFGIIALSAPLLSARMESTHRA